VSVNAPQFGVAANGLATSAANFLPFNFLPASSTNSAIPDFKTIAASFFAAPTVTTVDIPVETKPAAGTKSVGLFLPRERENNKDKDAQSSELPATFLSTTPIYPFPTLSSEAPKHPEPMTVSAPMQTKADSTTLISSFPVVYQPLNSARSLASQATTSIPTKVPALQQEAKAGDIESTMPVMPKAASDNAENMGADDKTAGIVKIDSKPAPSQVKTESEITNVGQKEEPPQGGKTIVGAQLPTSLDPRRAVDKVQPQVEITSNAAKIAPSPKNKEAAPLVAINEIDTGVTTAEVGTRGADARAFRQKLSSKIEKPTVSNENKEFIQTKQSTQTVWDTSADSIQASSATESDQTLRQQPAPAPQSIDEAIKAVLPQAVILERDASGVALKHSTNLYSTQSSKSATKFNQNETNPAEPATIVPAATSTEAINAPKANPIVGVNSKLPNDKSKTDVVVKKTQRASGENQSEPTAAADVSHRTETRAVSLAQSATSRNHDTITPQISMAPHAKSTLLRNAPEPSGLASSSTTQVPDIDDITPPSHTGVNTAKLVQGLTQSELRVGLQTRDFGNIDIRTSASRHEFSAQISVEHSEVAHTLTSELPNLYARLNEQQVPVTNIHIHNQSLSTSSGLDQRSHQSSQQRQSGGFTRPPEPTLPTAHEVFGPTDRLDIRV